MSSVMHTDMYVSTVILHVKWITSISPPSSSQCTNSSLKVVGSDNARYPLSCLLDITDADSAASELRGGCGE